MAIPDDDEHLNPTGFDPDFATPVAWAWMYRALGLQVVPCRDKRPDLHQWAGLQNELAPAFTFERWYGTGGEHASNGNMGIITGECSGRVFVLDLDIHKHPEAAAWWRELVEAENHGIEPETPSQLTGGGGVQKLFRAPPGWRPPTNRTAIGVDIRGVAGFAVMPPTRHASGANYGWLPGSAPWEIDIALAPQWLMDAIEMLVEAHGGGESVQRETTASPGSDFTDFGQRQDGREPYMRSVVWAAVVDLCRSNPIKPPDSQQRALAADAYEVYERNVVSRFTGAEKREGLEKSRRGPTEFWNKWRAAMRHWDGRVREAAKLPKPGQPHDYAADFAQPKVDPDTGQQLPLIQTAKQFLKGYVPPSYLVDGMVQRGYLYALTARTGHGKTAIAMLMGAAVARGVTFHGKQCEPGNVLFLAGENPQDVRARYRVLAHHEAFNAEEIPFHFVDGVIDLVASMDRIKAEAAKVGELSLIIVDTAQAYFRGDDVNNNAQQGQFAQLLRALIRLPGGPTVVVNCHPVKNAAQDNLVPMGGSHFINEVDANLTLWADERVCTLEPHNAKWRGAPFEAIQFELTTILCDAVKDAKGRHMPSVVAVPITEAGAERKAAVAEDDENTVLRLMHTYKNASFAYLAKMALFTVADGRANKSKVQRIVARLLASKLVYKYRGSKYRLTKKGCKVIGVKFESENDDD